VAGLLVGASYLVLSYVFRFLARSRGRGVAQPPVKVSDAGLYERYREISRALEAAGVVRAPAETPEEYARRAGAWLDEPAMTRLGEIYLYARFRDAVPAAMVEEFDRLEPKVRLAIACSSERTRAAPAVR
jgi:hypothetical protein